MVLGDSYFEFRFRSIIPLWSMDDRAEAEFKIAVAKYHHLPTILCCLNLMHVVMITNNMFILLSVIMNIRLNLHPQKL